MPCNIIDYSDTLSITFCHDLTKGGNQNFMQGELSHLKIQVTVEHTGGKNDYKTVIEDSKTNK